MGAGSRTIGYVVCGVLVPTIENESLGRESLGLRRLQQDKQRYSGAVTLQTPVRGRTNWLLYSTCAVSAAEARGCYWGRRSIGAIKEIRHRLSGPEHQPMVGEISAFGDVADTEPYRLSSSCWLLAGERWGFQKSSCRRTSECTVHSILSDIHEVCISGL